MKLDFIKTIIAIAISALIAYGFYVFNTNENKELLSIGSFVFFLVTSVLTIATNLKLPRTTSLIRTISVIFFFIALFSNIIFSFVNFREAVYIIVNGVLFLLFVLITYSITKAKQ